MSEAKRLYLTANGEGRSKTFERSLERCTAFLVQLLDDRPIDTCQRKEINTTRLRNRSTRFTNFSLNGFTLATNWLLRLVAGD